MQPVATVVVPDTDTPSSPNGVASKPSLHNQSTSSSQYPDDENEERGNWSGRFDFILSLLGYAVGLGNVWRFPYLCYRNGGGAFLIPYAIMLVFVGIPLFYLELAVGQFCSSGPLTCWQFAPIFKGIGIGQLVINSYVSIYYNMIIAWTLYYLFSSFINVKHLPWSNCNNDWNTFLCYDRLPDTACNSSQQTAYSNGTCYNRTAGEFQLAGIWDKQVFQNVTGLKRTSASEEYYNRRVLRLSSGIDELGPVIWDLALSLILAWVISFLCMVKGIKTTGKVVYVTALLPYVVLIILFGRGVSLPWAGQGINFYLKPDFARLREAKVWNDAALQIFFAMSNCWGGLIALASYNRFHNNFERDTIIVTIANFCTGIFAGFVIFSFLGFMAGTMNTSVEDVVDSGPGLAFIVYPDAVSRMPVSPLWAILFFLMLLTLGLDSQFAGLEAILTSAMDEFSVLRPHKTKVIFTMCVFFFLLGLPLCTPGGNYLLQLMDTYCTGWGLLIIALVECIAFSWVYGCDRLYEDMRIMIGKRPSLWWRICLQVLTPGFILFLLIFTWVDYSPARYGNYNYPAWADGMGWLMSLSVVIWIPVYAVYAICKEHDGTILERIRNLSLPTVYWGPALIRHRKLVDYVKGFVVDPFSADGALANGKKPTWTTSQTLSQSTPEIMGQRADSNFSVATTESSAAPLTLGWYSKPEANGFLRQPSIDRLLLLHRSRSTDTSGSFRYETSV